MNFSKRMDEDGSFLIPREAGVAFRCGKCSSVQLVFNVEKRQLICLACGNTADVKEDVDDDS